MVESEFLRLMEIVKKIPELVWKDIFNHWANDWFDMAMSSQDDATCERYMALYHLCTAFAELCDDELQNKQ